VQLVVQCLRQVVPERLGQRPAGLELHIVRALKKMKHASQHPAELVSMAVRSLWDTREAPHAYLERLGLDDAHSFKDLFMRRLFAGNL